LIIVALTTRMRCGELFNTTWRDVDFDKKTIGVNPKKEAEEAWEWHIRDTER
jgi:integrase